MNNHAKQIDLLNFECMKGEITMAGKYPNIPASPIPSGRQSPEGNTRWALVTIVLIITASALQAQLKNTQYTQLPAMAIEPVIVKPVGVYPQKIVRPQGPFLLYIENRLPGHAAHFSLTLNQANAAELTGLDTNSGSFRAQTILDLMPGVYVLHFQSSGTTSQNMTAQKQDALSVTIQITN